MPRKLKTWQTSLGFFDLAIAAPSMKAALEAWGSNANLFHQGFAREADDPAIIAAAMARPGVVLRRAVGSNARFSEHAALPRDLPAGEANGKRDKRAAKSPPAKPGAPDGKAARDAAVAYARDEARRERERRAQEVARAVERERREQAVRKAEAALDHARRVHATTIEEIAAERSALDRRSEAEDTRWDRQRAKLQASLDRARG